jgi:hypothetical protein
MGGDEILAIVADLLGFVGALLLAVPFFVGQVPRDTVLLALARRSPDEVAFGPAVQRYVRHIASNWHWEVWAARLGTALIAFAFMIKLALGAAEYFWSHHG